MSLQINNFEKWNNEQMKNNPPDKYYYNPNFIISYIERKRIKKLVKLLEAEQNEKILEVGCGQGHILELIRNGELYGFDLSNEMLNDAKNRLGNKVKFFKANAEDFIKKLGNLKFDKVICSEVLEHTLEPRKVIEQIHQALLDNGSLVVSIPNERLINQIKTILIKTKIFDLLFGSISRNATQEFHLHAFDLLMLKQIVKERFEVEKVAKIPFVFLPIRYVVTLNKRQYQE